MTKESMPPIFVFGSNLAGRHGKGAAHYAWSNYQAKMGVGVGRTGNAYAIPTKDKRIITLPLMLIKPYVDDFLLYARTNPSLEFYVTRVGCGLAGYKDEDMAPMFSSAPENVILPEEWVKVLIALWREQGGEV
jgi:hypothetical protein